MENSQHNQPIEPATSQQGAPSFTNSQPGQQLPTGNQQQNTTTDNSAEQHSESSLPQDGNETLGTP